MAHRICRCRSAAQGLEQERLAAFVNTKIHAGEPLWVTSRPQTYEVLLPDPSRLPAAGQTREEATLAELTSAMAGGREFAELSHELQGR